MSRTLQANTPVTASICVVAPGGNTSPYLVLPAGDETFLVRNANGSNAYQINFTLIGMRDGWQFPGTAPNYGITFTGTPPTFTVTPTPQTNPTTIQLSITPGAGRFSYAFRVSVTNSTGTTTLTLDPTIKDSSST